jgi:8-oxo-dGTP diphosphatase
MDSQIAGIYGNKVRVRVCGVLIENGRILMVRHKGISDGSFWSPPGGGLEFGESVEEGLKREFIEETGLSVEIGRFRFGCQLVKPPIHAVELFFNVTRTGGTLIRGTDPEIQIVEEVAFSDFETLTSLSGTEKHGIFAIATTMEAFDRLNGFYTL